MRVCESYHREFLTKYNDKLSKACIITKLIVNCATLRLETCYRKSERYGWSLNSIIPLIQLRMLSDKHHYTFNTYRNDTRLLH